MLLLIGHWYEFQSTPPQGGRPVMIFTPLLNSWFQSTPPQGGRRRTGRAMGWYARFQSTPPQGGDKFFRE